MNKLVISILACYIAAPCDTGNGDHKNARLKTIIGDYIVVYERKLKAKVSTLTISNQKTKFDTTVATGGTFKKMHVDVKRNWVILIGDVKNSDNPDQFAVYNLIGDFLFNRGIQCENFPPRYGCTESLSMIKWYDPDAEIKVVEKGVTILAPDRKHDVFMNLKD